MTFQKARVGPIREETPDIRSLQLLPADDRPLAAFEPGAHVDLVLGEGVARSYSLINTTARDGTYRIGVKREPNSRGGSARVHRLAEGDLLELSEPRNNFPLAVGDADSLLIAGGIGVTPLIGMAAHLAEAGRPFQFEYLARGPEHAAFLAEMQEAFGDRLTPSFGLEAAGVESRLDALLAQQGPATQVYLCGPGPLMELGRKVAARHPHCTLHLEYFSGDPALDAMEKGTFRVQLAGRGQIYTVPEDKTIIEVLAENGVVIPTSCEQGICGTCLTKVLAGRPDHRDMLLSDAEKDANDQMLLCVSRSHDPMLILDL